MHEICNEGFLVLKKAYLLRYMFEPAHSGNLLNHYFLLTNGDLRFSNHSFGSVRALSVPGQATKSGEFRGASFPSNTASSSAFA